MYIARGGTDSLQDTSQMIGKSVVFVIVGT